MGSTADTVAAITHHHEELQAQLAGRVDAVLDTVRTGFSPHVAVAELADLLAVDVVPHARAEEDVLYSAAPLALRPLVLGMVMEHQDLLRLAGNVTTARTGADVAAAAYALRVLFENHVRKENELLVPALADDPTADLPALLERMAQRFHAYQPARAGSPA